MHALHAPRNDPMVMESKISKIIVRQVLVDTGSLVDIISFTCLKKLRYDVKDLEALGASIIGFGG